MNLQQNADDLISIVVPIYGVEKYLEKCVESIQKQTYKNIEIILVDDGSPDKCPDICEEIAKKDSRIKVIHKKNGGLSDARNVGIEAAKGEYITFIDSDDYVMPQMIEALYNRMTRDKSDLAICNIQYIDEFGECIEATEGKVEDEVLNEEQFWKKYFQNYHTYCVVAWNKLYKRNLFNHLRYPKGRLHEDEYIIHKIISQCDKISFLAGKYYCYLQRSNSIMQSSFSVKRLDAAEALIMRSSYFQSNRCNQLAEKTLIQSIGIMQQGYQWLDMKEDRNRKRFKEIHKEYRRVYLKIVKSKASIQFLLNGMTFFIGSRTYNLTHFYKR